MAIIQPGNYWYASISWRTDGTPYFNDDNLYTNFAELEALINTVFSPGIANLQADFATLDDALFNPTTGYISEFTLFMLELDKVIYHEAVYWYDIYGNPRYAPAGSWIDLLNTALADTITGVREDILPLLNELDWDVFELSKHLYMETDITVRRNYRAIDSLIDEIFPSHDFYEDDDGEIIFVPGNSIIVSMEDDIDNLYDIIKNDVVLPMNVLVERQKSILSILFPDWYSYIDAFGNEITVLGNDIITPISNRLSELESKFTAFPVIIQGMIDTALVSVTEKLDTIPATIRTMIDNSLIDIKASIQLLDNTIENTIKPDILSLVDSLDELETSIISEVSELLTPTEQRISSLEIETTNIIKIIYLFLTNPSLIFTFIQAQTSLTPNDIKRNWKQFAANILE